MGKSFLIIFGVYFLYYTGNILYDLFLKKEKIVETENNEQSFSLSELADQYQEKPISVEIEDVENIRTPQSFENEPYDFLSANEEPQSMEDLQKKYEDENQLNEMEHSETPQEKIEEKTGVELIFDLPTEIEKKGYGLIKNTILDSSKLEDLGWEAKYSLDRAIDKIFKIL